MEILCIIPARGGSKGIPLKNIINILGKPLLGYSLDAVKSSRYISRIVVSTDHSEIAKIAKDNGAEVITRPAEISGDLSSSEAALLHVMDSLKQSENYQPDLIVFLQCTSPLTLTEDIDGTIEKLIHENADSALAVTSFHYYLWGNNETGAIGINHDKSKRLMRQENKKQFLETGAVYVMKSKGFLENKHRFFGKTVMHEMPEERCFEIDEPVDLVIAEQMLKFQVIDP